uniref:Putative membrane protein n=2 Tax=Culex tarsalis TaxID=7177 RepID=A0A1Q3FVE8_CULTA
MKCYQKYVSIANSFKLIKSNIRIRESYRMKKKRSSDTIQQMWISNLSILFSIFVSFSLSLIVLSPDFSFFLFSLRSDKLHNTDKLREGIGFSFFFYLNVRFVIDKLKLKSNNSYLPSWPLFDSHLLVMLMVVGAVAAAVVTAVDTTDAAAEDEVGTAETCVVAVVVVVVMVTAPLSGAGPVTWINLMLLDVVESGCCCCCWAARMLTVGIRMPPPLLFTIVVAADAAETAPSSCCCCWPTTLFISFCCCICCCCCCCCCCCWMG